MNVQTNKTPHSDDSARHLTAASAPQRRILEKNSSLVQSISATFNSGNEEKVANTELFVSVERRSDNLRLGEGRETKKAFGKNSSNEIRLTPENAANREDFNGARVSVNISPDGNARWDFSLTLRVAFADGSTMTNVFSDHWLSQENRVNAYDCYPAAA